jgi:hypothetical protein
VSRTRVYHSSSDDEQDDQTEELKRPKKLVKKSSSQNKDVLKSLESFNSGFWKDSDDDEDRGLKRTSKNTVIR